MIHNYLSVLRNLLSVMLLMLFGLSSQAQTISYPATAQAQPLTRGLGSSLLTVRVDFSASCGATPTVTINLGATNSPGTVEYIAGSVVKTAGTPAVTITQGSIANLSSPVFNISGAAGGSFIEFTIARRINCGTASSTKDVVVLGGGCTLTENDPNVNTYNIMAPALTVNPPAQINNASVGSSYTRTFSVTNGGTGCLDTLFLWVKYPAGGATLNSLSLGSTVLTAAFTNGDSTLFKVAGAALGTGNQFCNGSTLNFTENVTLNSCNISTSYGAAWNDFSNAFCQTDVKSANVTMNNNLPTLTTTLVTGSDSLNYCYNGTAKIQKIRITNSGTGAATNIQQLLRTQIPGSFTASIRIDTVGGIVVKNAAGTIIGNIKNLTEVGTSHGLAWTQEGPAGSACAPVSSYIITLMANLGNIIIPGGSYIDLEVKTVPINYSCNSCRAEDIIGWIALQSQSNYKNQCATATYNESVKTLVQRNYVYARTNLEIPTDIVGGESFNFALFYTGGQAVTSNDGTGNMYFKLDLKNTDITTTATSLTVGPYTIPVTVVNDTLIAGPFPQNANWGSSLITLPLTAHCGTGGVKTLNYWHTSKYNTCSPEFKFACKSAQINIHCPDPCPKGGATPVKFTFNRINYGLPDNNNDGKADASGVIDLTKINTKHAVHADTIQGVWNIKIHPNTDTSDPNFSQGVIKHVYVDFRLTNGTTGTPGVDNGTFMPITNGATATIYPVGGGAPIVCNNVITTITNTRYAHFEIPNTCRVWQAGDSIVFKANFRTTAYNAGFGNTSAFLNFVTENSVYGTYTPKTTNQTAPVTGETYTCSSFNDYLQISYTWRQPYMVNPQYINGCTSQIEIHTRQFIRSQEINAVFPFEVRTFSYPETTKVRVPKGMKYRPNSASMRNASTYDNVLRTLPDSYVSQVGDTIIFSNTQNMFQAYGGVMPNPDEGYIVLFYFSIDPTCATVSGLDTAVTWGTIRGDGSAIATSLPDVSAPVLPIGYNVSLPQPNLSGGGLYNSTDGIGRWSVVLQNQSNTVPADNSWFYIDPKNGLTDIIVKEGTTTIAPNANGFYQLGTLASGASRTFDISARTTVCTADSMRINSGYSCGSYPAAFNLQSCTETRWLKVENEQTQIQIAVSQQPATNINLCVSNTVDFTINSALAAYADNPQFVVTPPTGVNITAQQIEWPLGSGTWQTITPTSTGGQLIYNIENHTGLAAAHGTKGLPGTGDNPATAGRQAKLRLTFMTDCNFVSGSKFTVAQRAVRPCGDLVSSQLGYDNIVRTDPININGANSAGKVDVTSNISTNPVSCGATPVTGVLMPMIEPFGNSDTLIITLQSGVNFSGSFSGPTGMSVVSGYPQAGAGGTQVMKVKIPAGTNPGAGNELNYSFNVIASSASGCGNFSVLTEVERTGAILNCNGSTCPSGAKSIVGAKDTSLDVSKGDIEITNMTLSGGGAHTIGNNTYSVSIKNNGTSAIAANSVSLGFFCGSSTSAFDTKLFPTAIAAGATVTANITVNVPGTPTCAANSLVKVVANPSTASNCLCDVSEFTLGTPLPVDVLSFDAIKEGKEVKTSWTVARERNVKQYHVEHSVDAAIYSRIGTKPAIGNSTYDLNHSHPVVGANYYRLIVEDMDGSINTSGAVRVMFDNGTGIKIYPNPASDKLTIELPSTPKDGLYQIMDVYGREVMTGKGLTSGKNVLNVGGIVSGSYFIRVTLDGSSEVYKLTIVR